LCKGGKLLRQVEFAVRAGYLGNSRLQGERSGNANSGPLGNTPSQRSPRTSGRSTSPTNPGSSSLSGSGPLVPSGPCRGLVRHALGPPPSSARCDGPLKPSLPLSTLWSSPGATTPNGVARLFGTVSLDPSAPSKDVHAGFDRGAGGKAPG
jgi:hypothetical protein